MANNAPYDLPPPRRRRRESPPPALARFTAASLILVGLLFGLAGGLYYAWVINPIVLTDALPGRLRPDLRDDYLYLISQSYAADGDIARARARLAALDVADLPALLDSELQRYLRSGRPAADVRNLAELAEGLGVEGAGVALFAPTAAVTAAVPTFTPAPNVPTATLLPTPTLTPTAAPTLTPSATPLPSTTPTATPEPVYRLLSQERACAPERGAPLIAVVVVDALLEPLPGAEILVSWDGGGDRFFTGFQPQESRGYGDFVMTAEVSYSVTIGSGNPTVSGLRVEPCSDGAPGGWRLTFQNLIVGLPGPDAGGDS